MRMKVTEALPDAETINTMDRMQIQNQMLKEIV